MPWISKEMCTGCGICVKECPVCAIELKPDGFAEINDVGCIRCGRCHDVCPQEAIRHDSERIHRDVADNLRWVRKLLGHFNLPEEQTAFMERMVRFFGKQIKVGEETVAAIISSGDNPVEGVDAAINKFSSSQRGESSG